MPARPYRFPLFCFVLLAACQSVPPFPKGVVSLRGLELPLPAPDGLPTMELPYGDSSASARLASAWAGRREDPLSDWATARAELLRGPGGARGALPLFDRAMERVPATRRCEVEADRLIARFAAGRAAAALGDSGCASETEAGRGALASIFGSLGFSVAAARYAGPNAGGSADPATAEAWGMGNKRDEKGELIGNTVRDPRELINRGFPLLGEILASADPRAQAEKLAELASLAEETASAYSVPAARKWWTDLLELDPRSPRLRAFLDLSSEPNERPPNVELAKQRAANCAGLAEELGPVAGNLPRLRALHLAAYNLDVFSLPGAKAAWEAVLAESSAWPWIAVTACDRIAYLEIRAGRISAALDVLDRAARAAGDHSLAAGQAEIELRRMDFERRPATLPALTERVLTLHRELREDLPPSSALKLLDYLASFAVQNRWTLLADAAASEAMALSELWDKRCAAGTAISVLARVPNSSRQRIPALLRSAAAVDACGQAGPTLLEYSALAEEYFQSGDSASASDALSRARAAASRLPGLWRLATMGAELADANAPSDLLDRFDAGFSILEDQPVDHDFRGWLGNAYEARLERLARSGAPSPDFLSLLARRESVRWQLPRSEAPPPGPGSPTLLALEASDSGELLIASSAAASVRVETLAEAPAVLLDSCALEGRDLVAAALAAPDSPSSALAPPRSALGSVSRLLGLDQPSAASSPPAPPLLLTGSGPSFSVPAALLPTPGGPLGLSRPTGLWVPSARPAAAWESGLVLSASPEPSAPAFHGLRELLAALDPARWARKAIRSPAEIPPLLAQRSVVHLSGHGRVAPGQAWVELADDDGGNSGRLDSRALRDLPLAPGALVVLAACETAGGRPGDVGPELPLAAFAAGASAVLFSRYPAPSRALHEALTSLYEQLPFPCAELVPRWHAVRTRFGSRLLGIEVAVSTPCLPSEPPPRTSARIR